MAQLTVFLARYQFPDEIEEIEWNPLSTGFSREEIEWNPLGLHLPDPEEQIFTMPAWL
jgi:hypothetical protein